MERSPGPGPRGARRWPSALTLPIALGFLLAAALLSGCGSLGPTEPPVATVPSGPVPALRHAWVIVLENKGYDRIATSSEMPYLHSLMERYGVAEGYQAVARPSQPNYLALFSGSTHGGRDNGAHDLDAPNLADQLEAVGRTWRLVAENYPGDCYLGDTAEGGRDGDGTYARKHAPAISFRSITSSPTRCADIVDLTAFEPDAADVQFIVPNLCHDLHDCPLAVGDAWLASIVPRILESPAYADGGLLVITFDEPAKETEGGDERVLTVVASPETPAGMRSSRAHTHYSLLRTIQAGFGLPCLEQSCGVPAMTEFFGPS
jgi:hypothetical protein